jgi:hypothetical protein
MKILKNQPFKLDCILHEVSLWNRDSALYKWRTQEYEGEAKMIFVKNQIWKCKYKLHESSLCCSIKRLKFAQIFGCNVYVVKAPVV